MYDHMTQRGYVENVHGAPMCACAEQVRATQAFCDAPPLHFITHLIFCVCSCYYTVDKDETETDDVDEDENEDKDEDEDVQVRPDDDSSYVPVVSLGDNDEDEDDAVGGNNNNANDVGEDEVVEGVIDAEDVGEDKIVEGVETNTKNQKRHYETWVNNYNDVVSYYNTNGDCQVTRDFATAEGCMLGNWVHDQRKKFKNGVLSDDRINLLSDLQFDFSIQTNVVGAKLTVPVAISNIFKYKKEHGNISVSNKEPHKQLRHWITHAKAVSRKTIEQGSGNPNFTLPNLKLLNELGIIKLPSNFKLKETQQQSLRRRRRRRSRRPRCLQTQRIRVHEQQFQEFQLLPQIQILLHHIQRPTHPSNQRSN
jgi:hypothetical protein